MSGRRRNDNLTVGDSDELRKRVCLKSPVRENHALSEAEGCTPGSVGGYAAGLIAVHNHPSGDPTPSEQDKLLTRDLVIAGRAMDIRIFDHIILGDGRYFSFADEGLIEEYQVQAIL